MGLQSKLRTGVQLNLPIFVVEVRVIGAYFLMKRCIYALRGRNL